MDEKNWLLLNVLLKTPNITKAAAALGISQPGVSKRLRQIEDYFGTEIALRGKNSFVLTSAGGYLASYAAEMLEKLRSVHEYVNNMNEAVKGTLRVGASDYCVGFILPEILAEFRRYHPQVEFQVTSTQSHEILNLVASGAIHIGFAHGNNVMTPGRMLLLTEKMFVCSLQELDLEKLPLQPGIACGNDLLVALEANLWWAEKYKKPQKIAIQADCVKSGMRMIANGLGYGLLSEKAADQMDGIHKYAIRHPDRRPCTRLTWAITNQDAKRLRIVSCFLDVIRRYCEVQSG